MAIGNLASATLPNSFQFGQSVNSGTNALFKFRSQTLGDESWIGGGLTGCSIDNAGNLLRGTVSSPMSYVVFVAQNGSDTSGNGSAGNPYLTIQKGIDEAYLMASHMSPVSTRPVVWVMPGTYNENPVLKASVLVRGLGFNDTRVMGNWTIDGTFTTPPSNDARSGWADIGLFGTVVVDFLGFNSNEGKIFAYNTRFGGAITINGFSSINQFIVFCGEYFATVTLNGMVTQFNSFVSQGNPTIVCNYSTSGGNTFSQSGGNRGNISINGVSGTYTCILNGNANQGATLSLNGLNAIVIAGSNSLPLSTLISYSGGATLSQITLINDAYGTAYIPTSLPNWNGLQPTSVSNALDRIAAKIGPIP